MINRELEELMEAKVRSFVHEFDKVLQSWIVNGTI